MLLNGLKLYNEGVRNEPLWKFIRDNTRVPSLVMGDLEAQIASAELGVQRFAQLMDTYGKDTVLQATRQLMDYTEAMLRREIAKIPDGDYVAEGFLDDDGRTRGVTLPLKVTVRVRGDGVEVDTTGSSRAGADGLQRAVRRIDQGRLLFRLPGAAARYLHPSGIHPAERGLVPAGQGDVAARQHLQPDLAGGGGSAVQPDPAAVVDLIIKALAPVLPDKCTAGNAAVLSFAAYSGVRPSGDYWVFLEVNEAAMGGRPGSDGPDTVEELMRNTRNNPLEDLGMHLPLICDRYEVRDDVPPGAGKFRGGAGVVKSQRYLTPGFMTHESDRNEDAPWGIFGGKPGACQQGRAAATARPARSAISRRSSRACARRIGDAITYLLAGRRRLWRSAGARPAQGARRRARRLHHAVDHAGTITAWC